MKNSSVFESLSDDLSLPSSSDKADHPLKREAGLSRSLVTERGMTLYYVCSFDSFLCIGRVCLAAGSKRISADRVRWYTNQVGCVLAWWKLVEAAGRGCHGGQAFMSRGCYRHS